MPPFRRWAGGRSIRSIAGGGSYQDLKLPPTLSCLGWGSARKNRENILKGVVTVVLCACACPTLSPWTLAPTLDRVPLSQSQEDYTRKSKQPRLFLYRSLAPSLFGPHTLTTCACFIPRVLRQRGFVGWEKISEETSIEGKKIARAITLPLCFVSAGKHATVQRVNEFLSFAAEKFPLQKEKWLRSFYVRRSQFIGFFFCFTVLMGYYDMLSKEDKRLKKKE